MKSPNEAGSLLRSRPGRLPGSFLRPGDLPFEMVILWRHFPLLASIKHGDFGRQSLVKFVEVDVAEYRAERSALGDP